MIKTSPLIKNSEEALKDLVLICEKNSIDYRVFGSIAYVCAAGALYRIPGDVDAFVDASKFSLLEKELLRLGYQKGAHPHLLEFLTDEPLIRFRKGDRVLEPIGANFCNGEMRINLRIPVPIIGARLKFSLKTGAIAFHPQKYQFGKVSFVGLSKESYFMAMSIFINLIRIGSDKQDKRILDYQELSKKLDKSLVLKIKSENSGIYFGPVPAVTLSTQWFVNFLVMIAKIKMFTRKLNAN